MRIIYEPTGRAREYSPRALNYYDGCDHGCTYCYVPGIRRKTREDYAANVRVKRDLVKHLVGDLKKGVEEQVLLSFAGDPYCKHNDHVRMTTQVLCLFLIYKTPVAILTKGGMRSLQDLSIIERFGKNIKVGATACFVNNEQCAEFEPGAAITTDRLKALRSFYDAGIRTWLSLEPVIEPQQTIQIIRETREWVDEYKLGKLNHDPAREAEIDWPGYLDEAVTLLRETNRRIYVKEDLAKACKGVRLNPNERNMDLHALKGWIDTGE